MKKLFLAALCIFLFTGCATKQINDPTRPNEAVEALKNTGSWIIENVSWWDWGAW